MWSLDTARLAFESAVDSLWPHYSVFGDSTSIGIFVGAGFAAFGSAAWGETDGSDFAESIAIDFERCVGSMVLLFA